MRDTRVAAVQFEHAAADKKANLAKIRGFVEAAADQKVEIVVFPECCIPGYWFLRGLSRTELEALAEPVPDGPSSRSLCAPQVLVGAPVSVPIRRRVNHPL